MAEIISGIYKITNAITNDFYIGSSKDVKNRWALHKRPSVWRNNPNKQLYKDMQKYGVENFEFEIIEEAEEEKLKEMEQQFIETLKPTYNNYNAKGRNIERRKESNKEYQKTDKYKEYQKEYRQSDKGKETKRKYRQSDKYKESKRKSDNKYDNQLCCYNSETLTLHALSERFRRRGIPHPTIEAKKYSLN